MTTSRVVFLSEPAKATALPDARLSQLLRGVTLAGLAMVLLLPAARGHTETLGWLPLWLVGMPLVAWWSLYRFRLPLARPEPPRAVHAARRRRRGTQARRRSTSRSGLRTAA